MALSHRLPSIRSARDLSSSFTARVPFCVADSTPAFRAILLRVSSVKASRKSSALFFHDLSIGSTVGARMDSMSAACRAKSASSYSISVMRAFAAWFKKHLPSELTTLAPTMASADFVPVAVRVKYYGRAETKAAAMAWVDEAHIRPHPSPACLRMYR